MNIVFVGTPDFAVPSLQGLIKEGLNVSAVITQPDRPIGRKRVITPPPVKKVAEKENLKVLQPEKIKDEGFVEKLRREKPDLIIVVAYGQILPKSILEIPTIGCINVHASLLPKYRGASPIQWALVKGETETGVTTMWMDEGMDTGDIFLQESIEIDKLWSSQELTQKLSELGAKLLLETIDHIKDQNYIRIPQDDSQASYAPLLSKKHGKINWNHAAIDIYNQIRGLTPWPGTYTVRDNKKIKILKAKPFYNIKSCPGKYLGKIDDKGFLIGTGNGALLVTELQESGRNKMDAISYLLGHPMEEGENFSDEWK